MHLQNKVALVTGINNDVGRITAIAMAQAGAKVAIADEDEVRGEAIVELICQSGGEAFFHGTDITMERDVIKLIEAVVCRYDSLDIAFNNASFEADYLPIAQQSEDFVARLIDFNLNGTWTCIKQEIRQMLLQSGGVIINNVSTYRTDGRPGCAMYRANKAAIRAITETAAVEYAAYNIRVNAIAPGILQKATRLASGIEESSQRTPSAVFVPMRRDGKFQEVADTVVWLCSDHASFITGHILPIDGGLRALATQSLDS